MKTLFLSPCLVVTAIGLWMSGPGCTRRGHLAEPATRSTVSRPTPLELALAPHEGTNKLDMEIRRFQEQVRAGKQPGSALERLGWLFVMKSRESFDPGYYKLAEQCALALEASVSASQEALLLRGHVLHNLHQFVEAEPLARRLTSERGLPCDFGLLSDVLMEQGKLSEAADACQKMVDLRPDLHSYARGAHVRWLKGDIEGAKELMEMAASAAAPQDAESAAWVHTRLGLYAFQLGNMSQAERYCAIALDFQKEYPPALLLQGRVLLAQEKNAGAVSVLRRAAELNPLPEYQWALAEAFRANGQAENAEVVEQQLNSQGAATDPRTYALFLATRGQSAELALRFARAELGSRQDVFTHDALAWALAATGNWTEARQEIARALSEGTKDARLFFHAALIAYKVGDQEQAGLWAQEAAKFQQLLLPSERSQLHTLPLPSRIMARSGN